ncbi:MAG: SusC/RagA family TonB-linked outer membrane protein [Bacteroidetes bacterium]|nr:SusC/RagA family TonB-linked outer membrane protein [Bacteroidota bacterium]
MKKLLLVSLCFLMLCVTQVFAQNRTITGTVTAKDDGLPLPGVTVKVKGTTIGTQTNAEGKYSLSVPAGGSIVVSFVGYTSQTIAVGSRSTINVVLVSSSTEIGEVVVTGALGIKHSSKELGYSAATITPKELTQTNVTNVAQGLTGKVAGLGIYTLNNGVDPNITINLRGYRSLEGNNSALIVLDGVPVPGQTIGSINPGDIADVTILKGAGAAALYGSQASNGAILITTKRGTTDGKPIIQYENSFQLEKVAFFPKLQSGYGMYGGEPAPYTDPLTGFSNYVPYENQLYGPPFDGSTVQVGAPLDSANGKVITAKYSALSKNPVQQFFQTGLTEQNNISYQQGDSKNSFFMSAQNAYRTTVVPDDKNIKDAFSVRGHRTYGIFSLDYSVGYTKTNVSTYLSNSNDVTGTNGFNNVNPFGGVPGSFVTNAGANDLYSSILQWPAFLPIKNYSNSNSDIANASNFYDAYAINPYWILQHTRDNYERDVVLSQLKLQLDPTDWLTASYQVSNNFGIYQERITKDEVDFTPYGLSDYWSASNVPSGFTGTGKALGSVYDVYQFGDGTSAHTIGGDGYNRIEGDAVLNFHHTFFHDFKTNLILGNSIFQNYLKDQQTGSNQLAIPGLYNINYIGGLIQANEYEAKIRQIAYFADLDISYKGWATLEATFRNEQDSRLSKAERSFNYPSVKLAFVPTDAIPALRDNKVLSYAKIYGELSQVGNINVGPYTINNIYVVAPGFPYGSLFGVNQNTQNYSPTLKPELTKELEVGTELAFFDNRLDVNYTYYIQHDRNQTLPIGTSITTGFYSELINIGETQSSGQELSVTGQILTQAKNHFGFSLTVNASKNESKVISLIPGTNSLSLGNNLYAEVGKPFPLLEVTDFVRDPQGRVVVDAQTGYPATDQTKLNTEGRVTPEYIVGIQPNLSYKFVSLAAVFEYRGGDVVYNGLGGTMVFAGSSALTAEAGRSAFVYPNSVIQTSPGVYVPNTNVAVKNGNYGFWQGSAFSSTQSPFVTSGAFWKLREIDLAFKLDQFIKQTKFIKGATFALTGRNLFIWVPKSNIWTDPEFSNAGADSNLIGVNNANELPGTRIFGADLKLTF